MERTNAKACAAPDSRRRLLVAMIGAAVVTCLVTAGVAGATSLKQIWDGSATPTFTLQIPGSGVSSDAATAVVSTSSGVTYVAGCLGNAAGNNDLSLTEIVAGQKRWTKTYNGPAHGADTAQKIALGLKGVVYTAGWSNNAAGNADILLVKWSAAGKRLWVRRYDGPRHGDENVTGLGVDKKGNVTVVGPSIGAHGTDFAVVSWSAKGVRRWSWRYDGSGHGYDPPSDLLVAKDSSVYVTGSVWVTGAKYAAFTARLSPAGKKLWTRVYAGPDGWGANANALVACPKGGVYIAGSAIKATTGYDGMVVRYSSTGAPSVFALDSHGATGTTLQAFDDIAVTSGGHVIACGQTDETDSTGDAYFHDYTSTGATAWSPIILYGSNYQAFSLVTTDKFGGYYLVGSPVVSASASDIFIYKGNQNAGAGFWQCLWGNDGSHTGYNTANGVVVTGTTAYVVGSCAAAAAGTDQIVLGFQY